MSIIPFDGAIEAVATVGKTLIDRLVPDPAAKNAALMELAHLQQTGELALAANQLQTLTAQADVDKVEAGSGKVFVAGWRPFIGWVCGAGLLYQFILRDIITWVMALASPHTAAPPDLSLEQIMTLVTGMLGIAGMRTYEKQAGVARSEWHDPDKQ